MLDQRQRLIESVSAWPRKKGKALLLKYLNGETLSITDSIICKCLDCSGGEPRKCTAIGCPILPYSPYLNLED